MKQKLFIVSWSAPCKLPILLCTQQYRKLPHRKNNARFAPQI